MRCIAFAKFLRYRKSRIASLSAQCLVSTPSQELELTNSLTFRREWFDCVGDGHASSGRIAFFGDPVTVVAGMHTQAIFSLILARWNEKRGTTIQIELVCKHVLYTPASESWAELSWLVLCWLVGCYRAIAIAVANKQTKSMLLVRPVRVRVTGQREGRLTVRHTNDLPTNENVLLNEHIRRVHYLAANAGRLSEGVKRIGDDRKGVLMMAVREGWVNVVSISFGNRFTDTQQTLRYP